MFLVDFNKKRDFTYNSLDILSFYKFKTFKKNLRFKKYNVGLTKFIKNRKRYIVRKRRTSNILNYIYLYTWSKSYVLIKQTCRYNHCHLIGNYSFISTSSPNNNLTNEFSVSKKVLFNLSLFEKKKIFFLKKMFLNKNIGINYYFSAQSKSELSPLLMYLTSFYESKSLVNINLQRLYLYRLLMKVLLLKITQFLLSLRKVYTLMILTYKFLN